MRPAGARIRTTGLNAGTRPQLLGWLSGHGLDDNAPDITAALAKQLSVRNLPVLQHCEESDLQSLELPPPIRRALLAAFKALIEAPVRPGPLSRPRRSRSGHWDNYSLGHFPRRRMSWSWLADRQNRRTRPAPPCGTRPGAPNLVP